MTHDEITKLAREAGLFVPQAGIPENGALMRFAALVAAVEREACAKACDEMWTGYGDCGAICSSAIRARSKE